MSLRHRCAVAAETSMAATKAREERRGIDGDGGLGSTKLSRSVPRFYGLGTGCVCSGGGRQGGSLDGLGHEDRRWLGWRAQTR
ncbi:hypothetical protein M0R45_030960 [Rubus argutus]|uniref:Uncharacterized protein n=1 Tax=Rubus argutus TaxID=59490 RepID=A0AAW1WFU2_RUBAR